MLGIFVLLVSVLWIAIAAGLAGFISVKLVRGRWRAAVAVLLFLLIVPSPLIDEIVARRQFHQLCAHSEFQVDRSRAAGKTVYLAGVPDEDVHGTWVRVVRQPTRFVDATTGEVVIAYDRLVAAGGQLAQFMGVEGRVPMLFRGTCDLGYENNIDRTIKELNITVVRRP